MAGGGIVYRLVILTLATAWTLTAGFAAAQQLEVSGRVLDPRGAGLSEAAVELRPLLPAHRLAELQLAGTLRPEPVTRSRTDLGGEFVIAAPAAGFWTVVVRHPNHLPARRDLTPLLTARRLADVELPRRSELAARLAGAGGEPLPGVTLLAAGWSPAWKAASEAGWWPEERVVRTGAEGLVALPCASGEKVTIAAGRASARVRFLYEESDCGAGLLELSFGAGTYPARVVGADGAPAASAYGFFRWPYLAFGVTGEGGFVRGPMTPQIEVPVEFHGAAAYWGEPRWRPPPEDDAGDDGVPVLELPPAQAVRGRVVDAYHERPVSGVWLWLGRGARYFQAVEEGVFELRAPSRAALSFGGPGYLTIAYRPPTGGAELIVRMAPAMSLQGRVVDAAGEGIPGAAIGGDEVRRVTAGRRRRELQGGGYWQLEEIRTTTGGDGSFELRRLAPERRFELRAAASGYAARHQAVPPLLPGQPAEELVIVLERAYSGFGRVLNEREMPIGGAEVSLLPTLTGSAMEQDFEVRESYRAATDAEGWFTLRDLPAGTYYLAARAAGFPELLVPGVEVVAGDEPNDLGTLILAPGVLLSGRVRGAGGGPVAGAQLSVRDADGEQIVVQRAGSAWFASTASRQNGSFHFGGLPRDSRLVLLVVADGFLTRELAVTTGTDDQRLEVELARGARVAGTVLDPRGRPASGAAVSLQAAGAQRGLSTATSRTALTGEDGRFEAVGLRPGEYRIMARRGVEESEPVRRRLESEGLADLYLELRSKASLTVSVRDPRGRPMARAAVHLMPVADSPGPRRGRLERTGASGDVVFEPLDAGTYTVASGHPDLGTAEAKVEIADSAAQSLELRFTGGAGSAEGDERRLVSGRVIDPEGAPVSGASVWLEGAGVGRGATSDAGGGFELRAPPGEYRLGCRYEGFAEFLGEPFTLAESELSGVVVELTAGATVVGRIVGLGSDELARVVVLARGPYRGAGEFQFFGRRYGVVDFEGGLRIEGLGVGEWQVRAELLNPTRSASERVEVARGEREVAVELRFEAGNRLTGSVLRQGLPVAAGVVSVRCPGEFQGETFTGDDGRFAVDHVPGGRCTVRAVDPETGHSGEQRIELAGDVEVVLEITPDIIDP